MSINLERAKATPAQQITKQTIAAPMLTRAKRPPELQEIPDLSMVGMLPQLMSRKAEGN